MTVTRHPNNQGVSLQQWRKAAAGGETTLSGTDDFSAGLSYTVGAEQVFINGVLLERGVDYAATTGTTITGLTALVAGDVATVASPSAFNVANAIPKATVTAKGDLIAGTGASTVSNLAVGADGSTLVADSSTSTGLRYQVPVQQNPILNSAFQIWQRGTSVAVNGPGGLAYTSDRWQVQTAISGVNTTTTRQATGDTTNLPNIQYCARVQRNSGGTAIGYISLQQYMETINSIPFAGKTVTLSLYARKGANFSDASSALGVTLQTGTGTDQNNGGSGYTGLATPINSSATLTTTWQRFTFTGTIATTATEIGLNLYYLVAGTAGANDYFEVTGVQLEVGSVATPFKTYAATLQGELAACQRYYFQDAKAVVQSQQTAASGTIYQPYYLPVDMRTTPTVTQTGSVIASSNTSATTFTNDASAATTNKCGLYFTGGASSGLAYLYRPIQFSAEL